MRNMSFMLTTEQTKNRSKTVTRRLGWKFLKPGDQVMAVEKSQGLKKGEKIKRICVLVIISNTPEMLCKITPAEVTMEGFPGKSPEWFIDMFCRSHKNCTPETYVNRIEFKYTTNFNICPLCERVLNLSESNLTDKEYVYVCPGKGCDYKVKIKMDDCDLST